MSENGPLFKCSCLNVFFALTGEIQSQGCTSAKSYYLHRLLFPKLQIIVHHASYTSLMSKYIEMHLCLKSSILLTVYSSLEIWVRVQRIYARKIVFQCSNRRGALSWAFVKPTACSLGLRLSRWWQWVSRLHKWFCSPHHRESALCSSRHRLVRCTQRYSHPAREPELPANPQRERARPASRG